MTKKGWSLNALQSPACLHICCTVAHIGHHDEFIADLKASGRRMIVNESIIDCDDDDVGYDEYDDNQCSEMLISKQISDS